ncbi:insulinase family protein [Arenibacter sp. BSSL-BM3]|uniref:Insulinase family protein n=1 Tax=Arenibacter arenosicollis TaxID=2762274 RepID=A0ABR7QTN0_9FLAO|nr:insulinase family protein [Arenibacter arenosicollis]MBC8770544.1 insulinase family protein [Arenibacter arenosicollis]
MKNHRMGKGILMLLINIFFWSTVFLYSMTFKDTMPLDPSIRHGKLPNGLTYYIKPTGDGSSEMSLRLVVKAGSAVQDADQYELDHVMEHLAFKAGKNMTMAKANELGFRSGEINGNSPFDFTQYYFSSVDTKEKLKIAFQLFHDIIWDLDLKKEYIDSERSVILNEKGIRGGFGAKSILTDLESTMMGRGADRPSDFVQFINTFPYDALRRYYDDWYRPELMALVVVGDIVGVDALEKEIKDKFSRAKPLKNPRSPIRAFGAYRNSPPQFMNREHRLTTKESKRQAVNMRIYMRQRENLDKKGLELLKQEQKGHLLIDILNNRLKEKQDYYVSPYTVSPYMALPSSLGIKLHITMEEGTVEGTLSKTIQLLKELRTNGFSEPEFTRFKKEYLESLSKTDTMKQMFWEDNIVDHFVYDKILPANRMALLKNMMDDLTLEELNVFVRQYIKTDPQELDIIMLSPSGHRALSYTEKQIRGWISEANNLPITKYSPPKIPKELMEASLIQTLKPSTLQKNKVDIPGASEYTLGNGIKVVLKPFDAVLVPRERNKLSFHGFSSKGISCYSRSDYFSAMNAADIVYNSGVGGMDRFELKRYFAKNGYNAQVAPYVGYDEAGIRGSTSVKDLETAFQLVYLYFTEPNKDSLAFEDWKLRTRSSHALHSINSQDFKNFIKLKLGDSTFLPKGTKALEGVPNTDLDRAYGIYRTIFANAKNFTFIITGDFPEEEVLSLCRKYLGNLPTANVQPKSEIPKNTKKFRLPKPQEKVVVAKEFDREVKVQLEYISNLAERDLDWKQDLKLKLLQSMMNFSIMQEMRFNSIENEGIYTIKVVCNFDKDRLFNEVYVEFGASPEDVEQLIKAAKQFMRSFKNNGADVELLERFKLERVDYLERKKYHRGDTSKMIYDYYKYGTSWPRGGLEQRQAYIRSISPRDIEILAKRLLKGNPLEFKMLPAKRMH